MELPRQRWRAATGLGAALVGNAIYVIAGGPMPGFWFSSVNERWTVTIP